MEYPGHIVKAGEPNAQIVRVLKEQLNTFLPPVHQLDPALPEFGPRMRNAVKFFQACSVDTLGVPLVQSGQVDVLTWATLFGPFTVPISDHATDPYLACVLEIAAGEAAKQVREIPRNSNCGPDVETYLRSVGLDKGYAWCVAFLYWCCDTAARLQHRANPMVRTAGVLKHWQLAETHGATRILATSAAANPALVHAGAMFVIDHGQGLGHTGLVETVVGGLLTTLEGNTDGSRSREGSGVYRLTRKISDINRGFIDYSGVVVS